MEMTVRPIDEICSHLINRAKSCRILRGKEPLKLGPLLEGKHESDLEETTNGGLERMMKGWSSSRTMQKPPKGRNELGLAIAEDCAIALSGWTDDKDGMFSTIFSKHVTESTFSYIPFFFRTTSSITRSDSW